MNDLHITQTLLLISLGIITLLSLMLRELMLENKLQEKLHNEISKVYAKEIAELKKLLTTLPNEIKHIVANQPALQRQRYEQYMQNIAKCRKAVKPPKIPPPDMLNR